MGGSVAGMGSGVEFDLSQGACYYYWGGGVFSGRTGYRVMWRRGVIRVGWSVIELKMRTPRCSGTVASAMFVHSVCARWREG